MGLYEWMNEWIFWPLLSWMLLEEEEIIVAKNSEPTACWFPPPPSFSWVSIWICKWVAIFKIGPLGLCGFSWSVNGASNTHTHHEIQIHSFSVTEHPHFHCSMLQMELCTQQHVSLAPFAHVLNRIQRWRNHSASPLHRQGTESVCCNMPDTSLRLVE